MITVLYTFWPCHPYMYFHPSISLPCVHAQGVIYIIGHVVIVIVVSTKFTMSQNLQAPDHE